MKTSFVILSLIAATLVAGKIIHLNGKKVPPAAAVDSETAPDRSFTRIPRVDVPSEELAAPASQTPNEPVRASAVMSEPSDTASNSAANAAAPPTPFSRAIDTLVSPQASFQQKHEAWRQLQDSGQLEQAIEALKQGAAENPTSAGYPAALGQAQLYRAGEVARDGGSINEMGILGMQADQNFDTALKLDPANWEAQFFKAAAMSHWPLELNKGEEVVQRLSNLIDQQESMSVQPQFAQTYVLLGDQYQKMGNSEYATATWQIGVQKFPCNQELQQRIKEY
jgi:tetratricopeptide (TPR) repeat protein